VRLDQPLDLPGVTRHLEREPILRSQAAPEQLDLLGPGLDPARGADLSSFSDRHLAELEVDIHPIARTCSSFRRFGGRTDGANDIDAFALAAQPDKSQGRRP
jgi:hypothetical protein